MNLAFFTGPNCELCEHAQGVIDSLIAQDSAYAAITITQYNIKHNPDYYHLYAARIPVLKREDTQAELGWPFDVELLREFVSA